MIFHLAPDDKFINRARELFELVAPGHNTFLVYYGGFPQKAAYVTAAQRTFFFPQTDVAKMASIINDAETVDAVIVHSLNGVAADVVNSISRDTPIVWLPWGYDVYDATPSLQLRLFQRRTLNYVARHLPHR